MTKRFHCDGPDCGKVMAKDEWRIRVSVVEPPVPFESSVSVIDPDATPEELLGEIAENAGMLSAELIQEFDMTEDWDGELHFCSWSCHIMHGWKAREDQGTSETT